MVFFSVINVWIYKNNIYTLSNSHKTKEYAQPPLKRLWILPSVTHTLETGHWLCFTVAS